MLKQSLLCLALAGLLFSVGCKSHKDDPVMSTDGDVLSMAPVPLTPTDNPAISDVPMPAGFVEIVSVSRTDINGGSRTINHVYEGQAGMHDLVTYLRVNVGKHNWSRITDKEGKENSTLEFTKGRERLLIQIAQRDRYLRVTLNLASRTSVEPGEASPGM